MASKPNPRSGPVGDPVVVKLPYRETAITQEFKIQKLRSASNVEMVSITGLDLQGQLVHYQGLIVSLDDIPPLLRGIRKACAGPLEALLIEAEAHATTVAGDNPCQESAPSTQARQSRASRRTRRGSRGGA